jgi:hypothetical protein
VSSTNKILSQRGPAAHPGRGGINGSISSQSRSSTSRCCSLLGTTDDDQRSPPKIT